jgi:short-subunit dehydrogenase
LRGKAEVHALVADLTTVEGLGRTIEALRQQGPVNYLVNNAAMSTYGYFSEQSIEIQHDIVSLQINAVIALCRAVIPFMKQLGNGKIINVSSVASFVPLPRLTVYGGCKAFLMSYSEALQMELLNDGIKVQCLCPGFICREFNTIEAIKDFDSQGMPADQWMEVATIVTSSLEALDADHVIFAPGEANLQACREGAIRVLDQLG